jgi:hypothetical protein
LEEGAQTKQPLVKVRLGRAAARIDLAERLFVGFGFSKLLS